MNATTTQMKNEKRAMLRKKKYLKDKEELTKFLQNNIDIQKYVLKFIGPETIYKKYIDMIMKLNEELISSNETRTQVGSDQVKYGNKLYDIFHLIKNEMGEIHIVKMFFSKSIFNKLYKLEVVSYVKYYFNYRVPRNMYFYIMELLFYKQQTQLFRTTIQSDYIKELFKQRMTIYNDNRDYIRSFINKRFNINI
jgi:hypothetical protein